MKTTAFILSAFVFLLSLLPCSDASTCDEEVSDVVQVSTSHDHSEDHEDDCTTFCSCSCCGITIMITEAPDLLPFHMAEFPGEYVTYNNGYSYQSADNIWHPPSRG